MVVHVHPMLKKYSQYHPKQHWHVCKMYNGMGVFTMVYDCFQYMVNKVIHYWKQSLSQTILFQFFDALRSVPQFVTHFCHSASIESELKTPAHLRWTCTVTVRLYSCCREIWFMITVFFLQCYWHFSSVWVSFFNCFLMLTVIWADICGRSWDIFCTYL